jgi:hypothetical protein
MASASAPPREHGKVVTQLGPGENEKLPAPKRAASTTAANKKGFVEASPSRVLRDGEGTSLFTLSHHPKQCALEPLEK